MSGRTASRKPPSPSAERRLRAHGSRVVGEGGEQESHDAAVLEPAREVHEQPAHLRVAAGSGEGALHLGQGERAQAPQRLEGGGLEPGVGQGCRRARPAARASRISPEGGEPRPGARSGPRPAAAASSAGTALALPSRPSAAAAAQRTLQCSSSRARRRGGTAWGSAIAPRLSAAARRRLRSASRSAVDERAHRRHRPDRAQRLHRREAQLLARLVEEGEAAAPSPPGCAIWPRARRVAKRIRGSGSSRRGRRSAPRPPAPCACRGRARPAAAPGCSDRGAPPAGPSATLGASSSPRAERRRPPARSPAGSAAAATRAGAVAGSRRRPRVWAARTRTSGVRSLPRAWRRRGTTRSGGHAGEARPWRSPGSARSRRRAARRAAWPRPRAPGGRWRPPPPPSPPPRGRG